MFILLGLIFLLILSFPIIISLFKRGVHEESNGELTQLVGWEFKDIYKRKSFLFDNPSEFHFFNILQEIVGDQYYIFPQVHLNHLAEVRGGNQYSGQKYWTRINKKSVDFVLCDKTRVIPQLAIELDGSSHQLAHRKERDFFVDNLMKEIGLPILHVDVGITDRDFIKNAILNKLSNK
jgi:very-short-patch-repair endonuclease